MDESSGEDIVLKTEPKPFMLQLKPSLDNSSQNDEDDIYFSTNCLLKLKSDNKLSNPLPNKKKLFDSEDTFFKKNLFISDSAQKSDLKKSSEVVSTEQSSSNIKNYNSPRKKYVIKMIEKKKKNERILFTNKIVETEEPENNKKERRDFYGNVIKKKNKKKVKVSFIDNVTSHPLVEIINIESFKNFNYIEGMPKENVKVTDAECVCCLIF